MVFFQNGSEREYFMISNENELSLYSMQDRDSCARTVREIMRVRARGTLSP